MTLEIETTRPLRAARQLLALVEAVFGADQADEKPYLEWKSTLPLGKNEKKSHAAIARCIIGMANRLPGVALSHFGGCGYMVIGVEPGTVHGTTVPDAADFEDWVNRYAGADGPVWSMDSVTFHNASVLVITVEPPAPGDRIHALRMQMDKWEQGAIFVRKLGRTDKATPTDIRALEDRLLDGVQTGPTKIERIGVHPTHAMCIQVIDAEQAREDAAVRNAKDALAPLPGPTGPMTTVIGNITIPNVNYVSTKDAQEYRAQCDSYLAKYRRRAQRAAIRAAVEMHEDTFAVQIENGSDMALEDVQVRLTLPPELRAYESAADIDVDLPVPPTPPRTTLDVAFVPSSIFGRGFVPTAPLTLPQRGIQITGREVTTQIHLVHPHDTAVTPTFVLLTPMHALEGKTPTEAQWDLPVTVTARNRTGMERTSITVRPLETVLGIDMLLQP